MFSFHLPMFKRGWLYNIPFMGYLYGWQWKLIVISARKPRVQWQTVIRYPIAEA